MSGPAPTPARPLRQPLPGNPFPGIAALERRTGLAITARLSANEALPLYSEALTQRYGQALLEEARRYPDPTAFELRQALACRHAVSMDELLVDAGADALICLFLRAFTDPGSVVLHSTGTYPTFDYFARSLGLIPQPVNYRIDEHGPRADLAALAREAKRYQARVVYLANPDNPTGSEHSAQAIEAFARALPGGTLLLLDEAYEAFGNAGSSHLLPNLVRLRSFSKAHGLAGARIGYAMGPAALLKVAEQAKVHYAVSALAQQLALHALREEAHHRLVIAATHALRAQFAALAQAAGIGAYPSATNFVTLQPGSEQAAQRLRERLLAKGASIYLGCINQHISIARITLQPELFTPAISDVLLRSVEEATNEEQ
jgi:histidinol-phosphate aminotransferase